MAALRAGADHLAIGVPGVVGGDVASAAATVGHFGGRHLVCFGLFLVSKTASDDIQYMS